MVPVQNLLIIYPIVIIGSIIQGSISMGFALIVAPIIILLNPDFVPVPMILSAFFLSILVLLRDHKSLDYTGISFALFGRIGGSIIAAFLLTIISKNIYNIIFGSIIIIAAIITNLKFKIGINKLSLIIAGFLSGLMGTISAIGGPPIALLYQNQKDTKIRSSLSGYFLIGSIISLTALKISGRFTLNELKLFLILIPAIVTGFLISSILVKIPKEGFSKRLILSVSIISSVIIIIKTFVSIYI